jgi:4-amino-4-deoxy-L-arabinose transferase-like glycosyltransferase
LHLENEQPRVGLASAGLPIALALLTLWALVTAWCDTAQFGDNVEQYIWSHSMEWGYHKHPPLPTWGLGSLVAVMGPSRWLPVVLAGLCVLATLCLTWDVTRRLANVTVANVAALCWTLLQYFSSGIQLYNHNTVMVLCIAAVVWLALKAQEHRGWWVLVGIIAGASLLAKYQSAVPLLGVVGALWATGRLRQRAQRDGLLVALGLACGVFTPHLIWLVQHDFTTLRYVSQSVSSPGFVARLQSVLSFVANQVRVGFPLLMVLGLYGVWMRVSPPQAMPTTEQYGDAAAQRAWVVWVRALVWWPVCVVLLMALAGGVTLRNHWGVQVLQFACLPLAMWLCQRRKCQLVRFVTVVCVVHGVALGLYSHKQNDPQAMMSLHRRLDTLYPAKMMSQAALAQWVSVSRCDWRYVVGDYEAGLVGLYASAAPAVYVNPQATPWITAAQLKQHGAVYVVTSAADLPTDVVATRELFLTPDGHTQPGFSSIFLGVALPALACP